MPVEIRPSASRKRHRYDLPHPVLLLVNGQSRMGRQMFGEAIAALREAGVEVKEAILARDRAETHRLSSARLPRRAFGCGGRR
jgi:hypothetical protein